MEIPKASKIFAQLQREMQEYRNSLLITPLVIAGLLVTMMLLSVIFANRISIIGDGVMQVLVHDHHDSGAGIDISISYGDDEEQNWQIVERTPGAEEDWDFSRGWTYSTPRIGRGDSASGEGLDGVHSLNPALSVLNILFLFVMMLVSWGYLLGCLYQDRKDRSILFWKSMPVSEWQEVLCKLAVASLIVPLVFISLSIITQLSYIVLAMLLVWRMDMEATSVILDNVQLVPLLANQLGGMLVYILWTAPLYAWLMICSAAAKRSPFLLALAIPLTLIFIEQVFIGSSHVVTALSHHIPTLTQDDKDSMGLYMNGPVWSSLDWLGMLLGLLVAAALLTGAVWLRRHRFEV